MMTAFDVIYTKQEGFFRNGEFVVQKNFTAVHPVFAKNEKEARDKFTKETNFGQQRIKEVRQSGGNFLGAMFPDLESLKNSLNEEEGKTTKAS